MRQSVIRNIKAVIFDWAGTTIDYGCFAPLQVFVEVFARKGIDVTVDEARIPMGMLKRDHIRALCEMERIRNQWSQKFGRTLSQDDIDDLYTHFESSLIGILPKYTDLVPGIIETVDFLKKTDIKIGSTTGYTAKMMKIVAKEAKKRGYSPDCIVSSTDVPAGRPYPWMCYKNAIELGVFPLHAMVKVGDTISDIHEGINAGMWSVGVVRGSSQLGLSLEEIQKTQPEKLNSMIEKVKSEYLQAGAHYVIDSVVRLDQALLDIDLRLSRGQVPFGKTTTCKS